jgi:hypothetical protein
LIEKSMGEGMRGLDPGGRKIVLLLPELSQKVFIFAFEDLPPSVEEREELIRFRIKKQMPLLPEDIRMDFEVLPGTDKLRVVAAVAKTEVVQEYEEILQRLRYKVVLAGVPSLSLLNLLDPVREKNVILLDVEDDSFSLIAVTGGRATLYRQKPFGIDAGSGEGVSAKADNIVQEVVNTIHFIEDREKERVAAVWLRLAIQQPEDGLYARMEEKLALPLRRIESTLPPSLEAGSLRILSPLIGQIA